MRRDLLYSPRLLCERLAIESIRKKRLSQLKGTPAARLSLGHIESLELIVLARKLGINTIYDIGANVGTWSLLAQSLIPAAQIHAFEPLDRHQQEFRQSFGSSKEVVLHPIALGSQKAEQTLHVVSSSDSSSLLQSTELLEEHFGIREVGESKVQVWRLDDYQELKNLPSPDLLKLDIQGYELEALRGAPNCLKSVKALITEVSFVAFYRNQCLFHDLVAYLASFGLFTYAFGAGTATGSQVFQTDVLFVRSRPSNRSVITSGQSPI